MPGSFGGLLGSTALAPIDFVDTVASSIPFSPFERGEVNEKFLYAIGSPTLNRFAHEQQGATELISGIGGIYIRSEEHTSELQSLMRISYAVFCLKKKTINN